MYVQGNRFYVKAEFARISAIKLGRLSIDEPHSSYHLIAIKDDHLNLRECRLVSQERGEGWSLDSSLTMRPGSVETEKCLTVRP